MSPPPTHNGSAVRLIGKGSIYKPSGLDLELETPDSFEEFLFYRTLRRRGEAIFLQAPAVGYGSQSLVRSNCSNPTELRELQFYFYHHKIYKPCSHWKWASSSLT